MKYMKFFISFLFVILFSAEPVQSAGLIARYSFENNFRDLSGNNNHAAGQNANFEQGRAGRCIQLDGSGYVRIPYSSDFSFYDKITVEMWVYQTGRSLGTPRLFETANSRVRLWIPSNGLLYFGYIPEAGGYQYMYCREEDSGIFLDQWQHVIAMLGDGIMALYIDGKEAGRNDIPGRSSIIGMQAGDIFIGGIPNGDGLIGKIDEVRISSDIAINIPPVHMRLTSIPSRGALRVSANSMGVYGAANLRAVAELKSSVTKEVMRRTEFPPFQKGLAEIEFDAGALESGEYPVSVSLFNESGELLHQTEDVFAKLGPQSWEGAYERIVDEFVPSPWTPVKFEDNAVSIWGREYKYDVSSLFPSEIITGGQSILAGPIRLAARLGNDTLAWNNAEITIMDHTAGAAKIRAVSRTQNLEIIAVQTVEYDGMIKVEMTLNPLGAAVLDELALEIPLLPEHAEYVWKLPGKWSYVEQNAARLQDGLWQVEFINYIWIGDGERGFCWFAESQRNWINHRDFNAIKIWKLQTGTRLQIYFVNTPLVLNSSRTIVFGMQATPVKPRPKGWRKWRYGGGTGATIANLWASPTNVKYYFFPVPHNLNSYNSKISEYHARGQKFTAYSCYNYVSPSVPEWQYYKGDWQTSGITGGLTNPSDVARFGEPTVRACPFRENYIDYYVSLYDNYFRTTSADGIYIDISLPMICENPDHEECHYIDNNGETKYDLHIFSARKAYKGLYTAAKKEDENNIVICHMSTTLYIPQLSFCDAIVDGEQFRNTNFNGDYMASTSFDTWVAEFSARQFGLAQIFLPEFSDAQRNDEWRIRGLMGLTLLHDCRLWLAWINEKEVNEIWSVLDKVGMEHTEFIPYWTNRGLLKSSDNEVKVSAYYRPEREALLVIANNKPETKDVILTHNLSSIGLPPEKSLRVIDAKTDEIIPSHGDQFRAIVPGKDFLLVRVQSPEIFLPEEYFLSQNFPNPFNARTTIKYSIPEQVKVQIKIYNILGQEIAQLMNETKEAGDYSIEWDGVNAKNLPLASGIYFYRFKAGDFLRHKKMVIIR